MLAIDTAIAGVGVAVLYGDDVRARLRVEGTDQASVLVPAISDALKQAGIERQALSLIAVTTGPGSFTGVRVGLATARGLALALDLPLAGIATTTVLLAQAATSRRLRLAAIDSKLDDWFCAVDGESPFVATAQQLAADFATPCTVIGPDVLRLAPRLQDAEPLAVPVDPAVLGRLALAEGVEIWRKRNRKDGPPRPLYLRGVNVTAPDGSRRTVE